jgi:hypothetical protein
MKLSLLRDTFDEEFTLGRLFIDDEEFCFTVEDAVREKKIYGKTAIPAGTYDVVLSPSHRFQKTLPEILNVPNFKGIRIHAGNSAADTEGCVLVGQERSGNGVGKSRAAMAELMPILFAAKEGGNPIWIEIV